MNEKQVMERIVVLETKADDMRDDIRDIRKNMQILMELAHRGRGSLAAILWVGGCVTALLGLMATISGLFMESK